MFKVDSESQYSTPTPTDGVFHVEVDKLVPTVIVNDQYREAMGNQLIWAFLRQGLTETDMDFPEFIVSIAHFEALELHDTENKTVRFICKGVVVKEGK